MDETIICATYGDASPPDAAVLYFVRHSCADPLHAIKQAARACVALMAEPWPHGAFTIGDAVEHIPPDILLSYGITAFFQMNIRPDLVIPHDDDLLRLNP